MHACRRPRSGCQALHARHLAKTRPKRRLRQSTISSHETSRVPLTLQARHTAQPRQQAQPPTCSPGTHSCSKSQPGSVQAPLGCPVSSPHCQAPQLPASPVGPCRSSLRTLLTQPHPQGLDPSATLQGAHAASPQRRQSVTCPLAPSICCPLDPGRTLDLTQARISAQESTSCEPSGVR